MLSYKPKLKLRAVAILRNELDVLPLFLRHCDALFDEVFLVDHRSIDGSRELIMEAVTQRKHWTYYQMDSNFFLQEQVLNFLIDRFSADDFDYLFPLDADEFIIAKSRKELETRLIETPREPNEVFCFNWVNAINRKSLVNEKLSPRSNFLVSNEESIFTKVVLPINLIKEKNIRVSLGHHVGFDKSQNPITMKPLGKMLHLPIRSRRQLIKKAITMEFKNILNNEVNPGESYQFKRFLELFLQDGLSVKSMVSALALYQFGEPIIPLDWVEKFLTEGSFTSKLKKVPIAFDSSLKLKNLKNDVPIEKIFADLLLENRQIAPSQQTLRLEGNRLLLNT